MGRLESEVGNGKTNLAVFDSKFRREAERLVELLDADQGLEHLPFVNIHDTTGRPGDIEAALEGVFRLRDDRFTLVPPVDWWDEPYRAKGERGFFQNSFVFADSLLTDPNFAKVLNPLAVIAVDWLAANPRNGAINPHRYAWHDHAAAGRLVVMAFVLREGISRGLLDRALSEALAAGVLEHANFLLAEENYVAQHNHGLFSDAALALAARSLTPAPQAVTWSKTATSRFAAVLEHTVDQVDALHLEHSPDYHWTIHGALSRFASAGLFDELDLAGLVRQMEESGAWLVAPDGTLPPIGDTPEGRRPPREVAAVASTCSGLRAFYGAGYAIVRRGDSSLIITAAHHPTAHKHADDGSFCLYEDGLPLIVDSGDPGHDYGSVERRYGTSPMAHSTICVDGFDWARGGSAYGSGLVDAGEWGEFFAVLTCNPEAVPGGGVARRAFVYAPKRFLVVIDDVEAEGDRLLARHLPLASDLSATATPSGEVEIRREATTVARLIPFATADAEPDGVEIVTGRLRPEMAGFTFPSPDQRRPRVNVAVTAPAGKPRAFALILDPELDAKPTLAWSEAEDEVLVEVNGISDRLRLRLGRGSIDLEAPNGSY